MLIETDSRGNVVCLRRLCVAQQGAAEVLMERDFPSTPTERADQRAKRGPMEMPTLMFTPRLFEAVPRPGAAWNVSGVSRAQCDFAWQRLAQTAREDWAVYSKLRARFSSEYEDSMRRLLGSVEAL